MSVWLKAAHIVHWSSGAAACSSCRDFRASRQPSAEFCGVGHSTMFLTVEALAAESFDAPNAASASAVTPFITLKALTPRKREPQEAYQVGGEVRD
jgi:hypothetical protein